MVVMAVLEFLVFQIENFGKKNQIRGLGKKTPNHFGQVNYNLSSVIGMVFFISRIRTI
jgi:hypothetical protein